MWKYSIKSELFSLFKFQLMFSMAQSENVKSLSLRGRATCSGDPDTPVFLGGDIFISFPPPDLLTISDL